MLGDLISAHYLDLGSLTRTFHSMRYTPLPKRNTGQVLSFNRSHTQGCESAFIFCGSGSSCFSPCGSGSSCFFNADPDPAAFSMRIRVQLFYGVEKDEANFLDFFLFFFLNCSLLDPVPYRYIECGSGSRTKKECGSMWIRIHSPAHREYLGIPVSS